MYKFLPEQIENLREQLQAKTLKLEGINNIRKQNYSEMKTGNGQETSFPVDNSLLGNFVVNTNALNDIKNKLLNCEVIEPNNSDEIGIGSTIKISLFFDEDEERETFTLVETRLPKDPANFISINSPLGKAIVAKKQGDSFKYVVENRIFSGRIDEIVKTKEDINIK